MTNYRRTENFVFLSGLYSLVLLTVGLTSDSSRHDSAEGRDLKHGMAQLERYHTMVPLLLEGKEHRPISWLHSMGPPASLQILIEADGQQLILSLEKNEGLFSSNYTETHYREDGQTITGTHSSKMNCYYHGEVQGHTHSDVSLSTCSGLRGFILVENKMLMMEPAFEPANDTHVVYRGEHLRFPSGTCGHGHNISVGNPGNIRGLLQSPGTRHKRDAQKTTKYVELIIVADNREFHKQGKDVEKVKQRLAEIANYVDKFYRALNIRVALVGLEVWSDSDKCPVSQDPFTTLHEFLDWRKLKLLPQKPHDNAQLISHIMIVDSCGSGVYFQGTTIGMAPIMSMCTAEQSGGIVMDHSVNPLGAAVTLAHELGHNFGMNHDTPERGCGCRMTVDRGGCIMTPSTGYPFPTVFSTCSKKDLAASLEKGVGMCLYNIPEVKVLYGGQKCGNGYVEEGEECDCGEPEECLNPCCNATTCTLKGDAVCAHGQCCTDCKLKPAGTPCRESSNSCDLPEFCTGSSPHCPVNVYLHDGHACHSMDGYCYNGICQTHEQQCITLWGPGAKPAPGICFERVNSAGDPYGNCGKDSRGSFAKCEARDAKCGKIQCQGGANRPVIGTNAVSIETNIPLHEGGRILCRGTHVYLGDDMPDPGLVLVGTKCAEGMMCLNRQCRNVSVFGVHACSGKCHDRGVCNNKKNCHCEAHWAPPFCETVGFGGSVDSGPMRLAADRGAVAMGMLVTVPCLLAASLLACLKRKCLVRLLFANKKSAIQKLRSVGWSRAPRAPQSQPMCQSSPQHKSPSRAAGSRLDKPSHLSAVPLLPPPNIHSHSLRQLPQCPPVCQPIHISQPMPNKLGVGVATGLEALPSVPAHRPLPSLTHSAIRASPFLQLPYKANQVCAQDHEKPSPPKKPLPADPLIRGCRVSRNTSAVGVQTQGPGPLPIPIPAVPQPTAIPQPGRPPLRLPQSLYER
ncbi:disintegrin and metalloproteinase domain-containing protein 12 isoform X3 [Electrophorus electricus]|uniref:disintegrin and metalloproteinase domain-containing protein 12 isoform X3 n=1 Tax=Electrophorus electricus TaxID=8005 RepID=UPI0015D058C0|nr:disintegrin and metalloproteinase domain-containing protein 12 isoform X3 [Electrophorus electricus]